MILRPREPGVRVRAAELEDPGRVHEDAQALGVEVRRQERVDHVVDEIGSQLLLEIDPVVRWVEIRTVSIRTGRPPS